MVDVSCDILVSTYLGTLLGFVNTNPFHSPEIYLRRPPAKNEQYRLDNLLKATAERGVQIRIIVYKEVEKALTRECQLLYS